MMKKVTPPPVPQAPSDTATAPPAPAVPIMHNAQRTIRPSVSVLAQRQAQLSEAANQLKQELFGIDDVIDRVIHAIRAWYVLPELIHRPVIVCLWGLTGTGKTQLTRRLAQLLGFYDRFIEVQMDGFSNGANYRSNTISGMLGESNIQESAPGILVLDEFQRFRTTDTKGKDVKTERYQDIWALLSDGRLPPPMGALGNIERKLADAAYDAERKTNDEDERPNHKPYRFSLDAWDAAELKSMLKISNPLTEVMQWTPEQVQPLLNQFRNNQPSWETDYSKLLIFVCGNLDEMYHETAQRVEDCDTDADIFHRLTLKLSLIDVKKALSERFKPEQIARLGNEHVIYPSLSKSTYQRLIAQMCDRYVHDIQAESGVPFSLQPNVLHALYANAVFPTQGTRPLHSAVHSILSATLVNATLWVLEHGWDTQTPITVSMHTIHPAPTHANVNANANIQPPESFIHIEGTQQGQACSTTFAVNLEISRLKHKASHDFRTLLAVHEAGHALVYCLLMGRTPQEVKINIASFEGGYNSFAGIKATTRQNLLDMIGVGLGGRIAESLVFGANACTTGAEQDYQQVTELAARFVRHLGFGERISKTDTTVEPDTNINTDIAASNDAMEALLAQQYQRVQALLSQHRHALLAISDALLEQGLITPDGMQALMHQHGIATIACVDEDGLVLEPFARHLDAFRQSSQPFAPLPPCVPPSQET